MNVTSTTRARLVRNDEVTIAGACRILGIPAPDARRYLLEKQVLFSRARPDDVFASEPERVYLRSDIEAVALDYTAHRDRQIAEQQARHEARMAAARAAKEAKARQDAMTPYVSQDEAAALTGRSIDDPLFDELPYVNSNIQVRHAGGWASIVGALQSDANAASLDDGRLYAREDLEPYMPKAEHDAVMDIHIAVERFTKQAEQARMQLRRSGALCA